MTGVQTCALPIYVRGNVWRAVFGEFKQVRDETLNCVMCNLCIPVCIADIAPNLVFLYARRTFNYFYEKKTPNLTVRLSEIQAGKYQSDWDAIGKWISSEQSERGASELALGALPQRTDALNEGGDASPINWTRRA